MTIPQLGLPETKAMLIHVAEGMIASQDRLTQADKAIGDGDHGVGMSRGFNAVRENLPDQDFSSVGELLKTTGMTLLTSIGGAAGAVFGTLFMGGSVNLGEQTGFDAGALATFLDDGLQAVEGRGKAVPGDKTMVDALAPAAAAARERRSAPLEESLAGVVDAARLGMEATSDMVAKLGKAKTLGERSLGHPDPGAISIYLILNFMYQSVVGNEINKA
jgi:dihydroxyacetone kinase-like protein